MANGADRQAVRAMLLEKVSSLNDSMSELTQAFAAATPAERGQISDEMDAVGNERDACTYRIQDLDAQKTFTRPDATAEQVLANAIAAVGALVNTSAAVNAVLTSADNLVKAYTAKSTQAGGG